MTSFRDLHVKGAPFILANCWDCGSALMLENLGAQALATSSAAYAFTLGRPDGGTVTVRASGTDFAAHRNVLAAASSYFDARFGSGMRDSDDAVVVLDDMPSAVFECVLDRACVRGHRWRAGQFLYPL